MERHLKDILCKLLEKQAYSLEDSEIERCLKDCISSRKLIKIAQDHRLWLYCILEKHNYIKLDYNITDEEINKAFEDYFNAYLSKESQEFLGVEGVYKELKITERRGFKKGVYFALDQINKKHA